MPFSLVPALPSGPLTVPMLLDLVNPAKLDLISLDVKQWRESLRMPVMVHSRQDFAELCFSIYVSYQQAFQGIPAPRVASRAALESGNVEVRRQAHEDMLMLERRRAESFAFVTQHVGGDQLEDQERRCLTGREGGAIGFADDLAEAIEKYHAELYVRRLFYDAIAPWDYETRLRLATELLDEYGRFLLPDAHLKHPVVFAANFEPFVRAFVNQLHVIRKAWRE